MHSLTYKETSSYVVEKKPLWIELGNRIEQQLYVARTESNVPIYLTKVRIKSADSAYLKTKRKHKRDLGDITDWVGVRILCLFQQDLIEVHEFILRMLLGNRGDRLSTSSLPPKINEVIVFNWEKVDKPNVIREAITTALQSNNDVTWDAGSGEEAREFVYSFPAIPTFAAQKLSFELQNKGSGYKSVHYQVDIDGISVEIQLRTLLQDVWGELEHALSYKKGKIHSHIKNSFLLLSRELKAKDMLVGQLRNVSERERSFALFARGKSGPSKWLSYDTSLLSKLPQNVAFQKFLSDYFSEFKGDLNQRTTWSPDWCERIAQLLDYGRSCTGELLDDEQAPLNYFFDMERAFLCFCKGEIAEAQKIFEDYSKKDEYQNRWVVQYRLGEIHTIDGNIEKSLICFDECESLIARLNPEERDKKGEMYAKQKLANVYWSLGDEYLDIAIDKIAEAAALFPAMEEDKVVTTRDTVILYNNLCYYSLEKYIKYSTGAESSGSKDALTQLHQIKMDLNKFHQQLESFVAAHPEAANANAYDTLAWCAYIRYREPKSLAPISNKTAQDWLRDAHAHLQVMSQKSNNSSSPFVSMAIQHEHVQEIMASFDSEFRNKKADPPGT